MIDIVERLRDDRLRHSAYGDFRVMREAADEIELLREALRNIIAGNGGECGCAETARRALEQGRES